MPSPYPPAAIHVQAHVLRHHVGLVALAEAASEGIVELQTAPAVSYLCLLPFAKCAVASDVQVAQSHTELQMVGGTAG